jgi:hypothetical protein
MASFGRRRRGCGINSIDRGHPRKFAAYGLVGWWNVFAISAFNGSKPITFTDLFQQGRDATQANDGARATLLATGWNGAPCIDYGSARNIGYGTPSFPLGVQTMIALVSGVSANGYVMSHAGDDNYVFGNNAASMRTSRAGVTSQKAVSAAWIRDNVKKQIARTFGGTHATHLAFVCGVPQATTDVSLADDPGTGTSTGVFGIGCNPATLSLGATGLGCEWIVYSRVMPATVLRRIFNRQKALWPTVPVAA